MAKTVKENPLVTIYCGTKGRYEFLALLLNSITNQTYPNYDVLIFDDNETPVNITNIPFISPFLSYFNHTGHKWSVLFGQKKGPHAIHKLAVQTIRSPLIFRVDDDLILDKDCLEKLVNTITEKDNCGAVGGLILNPHISLKDQLLKPKPEKPSFIDEVSYSGKVLEDNGFPVHSPYLQWSMPESKSELEVQHLHCSYLFKRVAAITSNAWDEEAYNFLTAKGHNEETMGSYCMWLNGFKLYVNPAAVAWHLYSPAGGIRNDPKADHVSMKKHDDGIFFTWYKEQKRKFPEKFEKKYTI